MSGPHPIYLNPVDPSPSFDRARAEIARNIVDESRQQHKGPDDQDQP